MSRPIDRFTLVLLILLSACSTRSVHTGGAQPNAGLTEGTVKRLISTWQEEVRQYVDREGQGDPAVLSRTTGLHSRDSLRPGRITLGALDIESAPAGRNGWDVQGVLIGKQADGGRNWYVFVVGIVQRSDYRPRLIQDIRIVALSAQGKSLAWKTSAPEPQAVERYREAFGGTDPVRFPGDTDRFSMSVSGAAVHVQEAQSRADWSLRL